MAVKVGSRNEIQLGSNRYPIIGPVSQILFSQYPEKQVVGDPGPDDEPFLSNWAITDNRGGMGVFVLDPRDPRHIGRFWRSTANTLFKEAITLLDLATDCGSPTTSTDPDLTWEYNNEQYFAFGAEVYKWLDEAGTWSSKLTTLPTTPTAVVVFRTASVNKVVLACLNDTVDFDGTTWNTQAGTKSKYLVTWDDKVWKVDESGQLAFSSDTTSWTNDALLRLPSGQVTGLLVGPHPESKDPVIYAATVSGLWVHDDTTNTFEQTGLVVPATQDAGVGSASWRESLFYNAKLNGAVYRFNPIDSTLPVVTPMGLDLDDGLPSDLQGRLITLVPTHNWLTGLLDSGTNQEDGHLGLADVGFGGEVFPTRTGYTTVVAWNGVGWHTLYQSGSTDYVGRVLGVSHAYSSYRLWFGVNQKVYYIELDAAIANPRHNTTKKFSSTQAVHITPAFNGGTTGDKLGMLLKVRTQGCSANETVLVEVEYDLSETWTSLGTITTNGVTTYTLETTADEKDGRVYDYVRFRFTLSRGATNTNRPVVIYVVHPYLKLLPPVFGFDVVVDCSKSYGKYTAHQLRHNLVTAAKTQTLLNFSYQDEANDVHTYKVRVLEMAGSEQGGTQDWGVFKVRLVMVTDANMAAGWT